MAAQAFLTVWLTFPDWTVPGILAFCKGMEKKEFMLLNSIWISFAITVKPKYTATHTGIQKNMGFYLTQKLIRPSFEMSIGNRA